MKWSSVNSFFSFAGFGFFVVLFFFSVFSSFASSFVSFSLISSFRVWLGFLDCFKGLVDFSSVDFGFLRVFSGICRSISLYSILLLIGYGSMSLNSLGSIFFSNL